MTPRIRRMLLLAAGGVAVWYLVVLFGWALRPLHDAIPVGIDYNLDPPAAVSRELTCGTLFDAVASTGRSNVLTPQPKGAPPLRFTREECTLVQRNARIVFGLDTLGAVIVIGGLLVVAIRSRAEEPLPTARDRVVAAAA